MSSILINTTSYSITRLSLGGARSIVQHASLSHWREGRSPIGLRSSLSVFVSGQDVEPTYRRNYLSTTPMGPIEYCSRPSCMVPPSDLRLARLSFARGDPSSRVRHRVTNASSEFGWTQGARVPSTPRLPQPRHIHTNTSVWVIPFYLHSSNYSASC